MNMPIDKSLDPLLILRSYRLRQISIFIGGAILLVIPIYWDAQAWSTIIPLLCGLFMMVVCQILDHRGKSNVASITLVISLAIMSAALQWVDQGLRDASVLAFPIVLILAGMLIEVRSFIMLLAAMTAFLIFMTISTEVLHSRQNLAEYNPFDHLRDAIIYLLIAGWSVWFVVNDLRKTLLQLREQFEKYQASQQQLIHISQYDILTGLPNHFLERELVQQEIAHATRNSSRMAFMFVDVDNFKDVNDSLGHSAGDVFLKLVAARLKKTVRECDIVTRHAGDEFVIALSQISEIHEATVFASAILRNMKQPFMVCDAQVMTSCSIGIAIFPDDSQDYETLLRLSDIAMYQGKKAGRNTLCFFDPLMQSAITQRVALELNLRKAIESNQEFQLYYQIQVDNLNRPLGAESLIRWIRPVHGMVSPADFIPLAEETGLILPIGRWVLEAACIQLKNWQKDEVARNLVLSVNVSARQFHQPDFVAHIQSCIQRHAINPSLLKLELTEGMLLDNVENTIVIMNVLKKMGIRFSLDDFGTGYSSLQYLKQLPLSQLKIDQSFIRNLASDSSDRAIVSTIIAMAHSLSLEVIAEGVETEEQCHIILDSGCKCYQGYLFGRPMPIEQFDELIKRSTESETHAV